MKFIIDNALSHALAKGLRASGYDAVHVLELSLDRAKDEVIFVRAAEEGRVVVTTDSDFGTLLARRNESKPSLIMFREGVSPRSDRQLELLIANLGAIEDDLERGCIVVFDGSRVRIRALPSV